MDWLESIRRAIDCLERQVTDPESERDPAREAGISPFYLQRTFSVLTGTGMGEYVRCRRLYLAGLDVIAGRGKVIDIAYRYGYNTPESFTRAFTRFHGVSPAALRQQPARLRVFLPLKINLTLQGGNDMDFIIEQMPAFQVIGLAKSFSPETSYAQIPLFWDEAAKKYLNALMAGKAPETPLEQAIVENRIGMYGICLDDRGDDQFQYLIAGPYAGGNVPEGLTVHAFPALTWAKFRSTGPLPGALQAINTRIFREWLPGNPDWAADRNCTVEYYAPGDPQAADYECAIWLPVRPRKG